jgi:plastocyanin
VARVPGEEYARPAKLFAAEAPSKVPFYVAGGVLVAWALVLALTGIRRPGFPGSSGARRGVIGASLLLVLATMTTAITTAGEPEHAEAAAEATSSELTLKTDPQGIPIYDRKSGLVKQGAVTIKLINDATVAHNVAVAQGSKVLGKSDDVTSGQTELQLDLKPGRYAYYCTIDGHRAAGMEGTLTVQ